MMVKKSRRWVLKSTAAGAAMLLCAGWTKSRQLQFGIPIKQMKPGDYTWAPQRSPAGPIVMIVSLPEQRAYVYRDGILIAVSTCATGRKGHRTPSGAFTILQKDKDHVSSTYKGAKMPYMERLTWSGIALHAGNLPGYPASHGCIRLPLDFAHALFGITQLGAAVIIADGHSEPADVVHPGLFLPVVAADEAKAIIAKIVAKKLRPKRRHEGRHRPAKIVVSVADRMVSLFEDGHLRATDKISIELPDQPIGNHLFVLKSSTKNGSALVWTASKYQIGMNAAVNAAMSSEVIDRITTTQKMADAIHSLMHPGLMMIITDAAAPASSRSSRGFVIATHHDPSGWQTEVFKSP
jgi:L,D-transpeptidase catalytic domain